MAKSRKLVPEAGKHSGGAADATRLPAAGRGFFWASGLLLSALVRQLAAKVDDRLARRLTAFDDIGSRR